MKQTRQSLACAALLSLAACGGGGGGGGFPVSATAASPSASSGISAPAPVASQTTQPTNTAPVANAGSTQKVTTGSTVTLNGAGSSDANGDALTYSWTLTSKPTGSVAALTGATTATPTFIADVPGAYVATLVVNDGKANSTPVTVTVTADTVVGFDSMSPLPPNMPSMGLEAYSLSRIGDRVQLKSGSPRTLYSIAIAMSSWACESGGWTSTCTTTPGATFSVPITLTVFNSTGNPVATRLQTFSIPYRPSSDPSCTGGKWKAANGTCYNGFAYRGSRTFRVDWCALP